MTWEELKKKYDNSSFSYGNEIRMHLSDSLVAVFRTDGSCCLFYSNHKDRSGYDSYMTMNLGKRSFENVDKLFEALKGEEK